MPQIPVEPIIINEWQEAMADSPSLGIGLLQNCSIDAVGGCLMPNWAPTLYSNAHGSSAGTFSGADGTDKVFTLNSALPGLLQVGAAVTLATTGSLPTGLSAATTYFVIGAGGSAIKFATSYANALAGTAISLTGNGSGTITATTIDMGTPNSFAMSGTVAFVADSNGLVWCNEGSMFFLLIGNTLSNGSGKGLATFKVSDGSASYLFVYRNAAIDVCDITTSAKRHDPVGNSAWANSWQALNTASGTAAVHQAVLGQDNIIYSCDGRYVNAIQEVPGAVFDPGNTATYVYNATALTLPENDSANCLEQLGVNLLVGGASTNYIYPWDRTSPSFGLPLWAPEIAIAGMKNVGNQVYILAGTRGNVYSTTGYFVELVRKIPEWMLQDTGGPASLVTYGGIGSKNGALIFGAQPKNSAYSGVYMVYPDGRIVLENTPSQGAALPTVLGATSGELYYIGYPGYVDFIGNTRWSGGAAVFNSKLYNVGTKINKATFSVLEVQLDQPGGNGQTIAVSYRTAAAGSWTSLASYITDGTSTSFDTDIGLDNIENIQVQLTLGGAGNGSNGLRVRYVRLRP